MIPEKGRYRGAGFRQDGRCGAVEFTRTTTARFVVDPQDPLRPGIRRIQWPSPPLPFGAAASFDKR